MKGLGIYLAIHGHREELAESGLVDVFWSEAELSQVLAGSKIIVVIVTTSALRGASSQPAPFKMGGCASQNVDTVRHAVAAWAILKAALKKDINLLFGRKSSECDANGTRA